MAKKRPCWQRITRSLEWGLPALAIAACLWIGWSAIARVLYEARGHDSWDGHVYWAVGRALLNGVKPYSEFFEMKPPGIFVVAFLSYVCTGGRALGYLATGLAAATVGFAPALWLWIRRRKPDALFASLIAGAAATGCLFLFFIADREGWGFQVEGFGAAFAVLCVLSFSAPPKGWRTVLVSGALLFCSTVFKEPFLASLLGAGLLLSRSPRDALRRLGAPVLAAGAAWIVMLVASGMFYPFVVLYLQTQLRWRANTAGPLWENGLNVWKLLDAFANLSAFSAFLAWAVVLAAVHLALRLQTRTRWRDRLWDGAAFILSLSTIGISVFAGGAFLYDHHFILLVPVAFAFWCSVWEELPGRPRALALPLLALLTVPIAIAAFTYVPADLAARRKWNTEETLSARRNALALDAILDRCDIDRYLFLGPNGPHVFGYTRHSPLGPMFLQYGYYFDPAWDWLGKGFLHQVAQAKVAIWSRDTSYSPAIEAAIRAHLSAKPPPCAGKMPPADPRYEWLFASL